MLYFVLEDFLVSLFTPEFQTEMLLFPNCLIGTGYRLSPRGARAVLFPSFAAVNRVRQRDPSQLTFFWPSADSYLDPCLSSRFPGSFQRIEKDVKKTSVLSQRGKLKADRYSRHRENVVAAVGRRRLRISGAAQTPQVETGEGFCAFPVSEMRRWRLPLAGATGERWVTKDASPAPTERIAEREVRAPAVTPRKPGAVSKPWVGQLSSKPMAWIQTAFANINGTSKARVLGLAREPCGAG